jgi:hypothetical protein
MKIPHSLWAAMLLLFGVQYEPVSLRPGPPHIASPYEVVIDEIMADPTPAVALPSEEWIELRNVSAYPVDLQGWLLADGSGFSAPMPVFLLLPGRTVIICAQKADTALQPFGPVIALSRFPGLNNVAGVLSLVSPQGSTIHRVAYTDDWYDDALKKQGGWSLEMIDPGNPCAGNGNWTATKDSAGGTPGRRNSVYAINPDLKGPALSRAYATDSLHLVLVFDEPLDSLAAATGANFVVSDGIGVASTSILTGAANDHIALGLTQALSRNRIYKITVSGIKDCAGNGITMQNGVETGLAEAAAGSDILINEVLFNPKAGGSDYVEIYNNSNKIIDLGEVELASRNNNGAITGSGAVSPEPALLLPQRFMVITDDPEKVKNAYLVKENNAFAVPARMPALPNGSGTVLLLNQQGKILDELRYDEKWHFTMINNPEGVSLERMSYSAPTQSASNWHSAASSCGYGTPSYRNSQYSANEDVNAKLSVTPAVLSPDNDGQDDFATIEYEFPAPGFVANITVFNASGRPVRFLRRNALCGTKGSFTWDGMGENGRQLPAGWYVVFNMIYDLKGNIKRFKMPIILARRI